MNPEVYDWQQVHIAAAKVVLFVKAEDALQLHLRRQGVKDSNGQGLLGL